LSFEFYHEIVFLDLRTINVLLCTLKCRTNEGEKPNEKIGKDEKAGEIKSERDKQKRERMEKL
jgi:hypothetical protein